MKATNLHIPGVVLIEPDIHKDNRGYFFEAYNAKLYEKYGINNTFVQENHSRSDIKGTLRGLHFQNDPNSQAKLVTVIKGRATNIVLDVRKGSLTYKKYIAIELSEENKYQLFIPRGFAHGFFCSTDNVELIYKVDNYYNAEGMRHIIYNDPSIGIAWDKIFNGISPILSQNDMNGLLLDVIDCNYK